MTLENVPSLIYAFSPSFLKIKGDSVNQEVTIVVSANGLSTSFKRYTDAAKYITLPLSKIAKFAFANVDVNDVVVGIAPTLTTSKLVQNVSITVGVLTPVVIPCIYGAAQIGLQNSIYETVYKFSGMPLTLTQNILGTLYVDGTSIGDTLGDEYYISTATRYEIKSGATILKSFTIVPLAHCSESVYLRWIDPTGQYKYFEFLLGESYQETKAGDVISKELLSLDATSNGLYKASTKIMDVSGNAIKSLSVPTATYLQQKLLQSLEASIHVCMYLGDNKWVEVAARMTPIKIDERWKQNQTVNVEIVMPNLYLPSL